MAADAPTPPELAEALAGMEQIVAVAEWYRALLEARSFSRRSAEEMTVAFHRNVCNELDRQRVRTFELERALMMMGQK